MEMWWISHCQFRKMTVKRTKNLKKIIINRLDFLKDIDFLKCIYSQVLSVCKRSCQNPAGHTILMHQVKDGFLCNLKPGQVCQRFPLGRLKHFPSTTEFTVLMKKCAFLRLVNRNISSGKSVYLLRELHVVVNPPRL